MRSIILFAFLLFLSNSYSQLDKRVYLNNDFDTCSIDQARYYAEYKRSETDQHVAKNVFKLDGSLIRVITFLNDSLNDFDGPYYTFHDNGQMEDSMFYVNDELNGNCLSYFESGQLKVKGNFKEGEFHDSLLTFYPSGNKKRIDFYANGELIKGGIYDEKGMILPYEKYFVEAAYPGGKQAMMKFIMENVVYPEDAIVYEIEGKVYIQFIVDSLGNVKKPKVVRSISPILSEAALDVIDKMPNWTPGRIDGENYESYFQLPINFDLDGGASKVNKRLLANLFWEKKDKMMDPMYNNKMDVSRRGKTTIYYKDSDTGRTKTASLTVKELEDFRNLKFGSLSSCNEWYHLYNLQKVEDLKKMGR
jgi:TonB family protein